MSGEGGREYASMQDYAAQLTNAPPQEQTEAFIRATVNEQINGGAVIVEQPDYGKLTVYAKDFPVPISTEQMLEMHERFEVIYQPVVAFARNLDQRPVPVRFEKLFGSQKSVDKSLKQKEKLAKQAEKADKDLAKQQQAKPRHGLEKGSWFNPKGWKQEFEKEFGVNPEQITTGYTARTPEPEQENPYTLGIDFDRRYRGRGVLVANVLPNGPAAASVLRAGDIIKAVGPFETRSGIVAGPYRIDRVGQLQRTLSWVRGGAAFPMKVVRGQNYVDVVVMPQLKNKPNAPTT